MNNLAGSAGYWLLWAQTPFESMSSQFRGERAKPQIDEVVIGALTLAGVAAAAWIFTRLVARADRIRRCNSPQALFGRLCRAHGLGFHDRRLLAQLARHHRLGHPARLFIESERFELSALSPGLLRYAARLGELRDTLFAEPPDAEAFSTLAGYAAGIDLPAETARDAAPTARAGMREAVAISPAISP